MLLQPFRLVPILFFRKVDSLTAEPVTGSTGFCRIRASWNTHVEGTTSTSSAFPSDVRVSSRVDDPFGYVTSDVLNSSRIPVADYSSVGPLGYVAKDVPTDFNFPTGRPSVTTTALGRGRSLGLTTTSFRVTSPSHSTPDIASVLRTGRVGILGFEWISIMLLKKGVGGAGELCLRVSSGSTLNVHGHVRAIS